MAYSFYFESKFRSWREVNKLQFQIPDGTEFTISDEWIISNQKNIILPVQRIIFRKENNYEQKYQITVEMSSSVNYTSGKLVMTRITKPIRTSIIVRLTDFLLLKYPVREKVSVEGVDIYERVTTDVFRYKVTITRFHIPEALRADDEFPQRDKILILSNQIHSLLQSANFSDVIITDGYSEIPAHRNILSARSVYFKCMFRQEWRENLEGVVHMHGVDMPILKEMLHFIYSGVIRPMQFETMFDLFEMADMYIMHDLKELLSNDLKKRLTAENAVGVFMLSHFFTDTKLKNDSLSFIVENFVQVQQTEFWICLQDEEEFSGIVQTINDSINMQG